MATAVDIAKLRASTGAGMMDCKKALEEANGDFDSAAEILRKKGVIKAAKRADKIAAEGVTVVKTAGDVGAVIELNSETDFVAKNEDFCKLADEIASEVLSKKPANLEVILNGGIQEKINTLVTKIGEKISLRRFELVEKSPAETFGTYIHMGGKISVLAVFSGAMSEQVARDVSMHAAAASPRYLNRAQVLPEELNKEKEIYAEQLKAQNKPQNIVENIVKGKLEKFYSEVCLLEQPFIKDEDKKVEQVLKEAGMELKKYVRFELGEGIEKKQADFAAEVAEQLK